MPLTKKSETVELQVYFCTRAKKQGSNANEVKPETCILRSLAMFFATRHLHVEDVQYLKECKRAKTKEQHIFVYHITEHNLRSQIFRKQLLNHLDANDCLIFVRKVELDFPSLLAYFLSGCTIDLKSKLKYFHEKAVHVYSSCYEDAVIDLVREVKTMQGKIAGKRAVAPQTFPFISGKTLASLSFGLPCNQIKVESVMNVPGRKKVAVRLRKCTTQKHSSDLKDKGRYGETKPDLTRSEQEINAPLAVTSIELRMRKTLLKSRCSRSTYSRSKNCSEYVHSDKRNLNVEESAKVTDPKCNKDNDFIDGNSSRPQGNRRESRASSSAASSSSSLSSSLKEQKEKPSSSAFKKSLQVKSSVPVDKAAHIMLGTIEKSPIAKETNEGDFPVEEEKRGREASREEEWERVSLDAVPIIEKCPKSPEEGKSQFSEDDLFEDDWQYHHSKMYAVYVPDRWGTNGEKLIYINFPQDTDKLPTQIVDFHSSGFSTPASLHLSEECFTPVERPLSADYLPSSSLPCLHS